MAEPTFQEVWETLGLDRTIEADLDKTLVREQSPRDTLRDSLPQLPVGDDADSHFQISQILGSGGMGVVHLAHQSSLNRDVAIKTVRSEGSRAAENALLQEARVMGMVEHPNVVPVHIIGQDNNGRPIIVMKRIDGTAWNDYVDRQTPVEGDWLSFHVGITISICRALSLAHDRQIVHRDIKPENVMVGSYGEVYLLDWGLAVSMDPDSPKIPYAGDANEVVGTPGYMAPEMTIGQGAGLGVHTDVFLVGAALYHVATGAPPNRGDSLFEALRFVYEGRDRMYPADTPVELVDICERAMAHDPADRYQDIDDLRVALEDFLTHRDSHALAAEAHEQLTNLRSAIRDDEHEQVTVLYSEVRFGFLSALKLWKQNADAKRGLAQCLDLMFDYELGRENIAAARAVLTHMTGDTAEQQVRLDELEAALEAQKQRLEKFAYDYDENVGGRMRWMGIAALAVCFFLAPFLKFAFYRSDIPEWLYWAGKTPDILVGNLIALGLAPVVFVYGLVTYKYLRDHKASRIIVNSLIQLYIFAAAIRTSTVWAEMPVSLAVAAECAVLSAGFLPLGMAVDRRFSMGAFAYLPAPIVIYMYPSQATNIFLVSSVFACLGFLVYFRLPWTPK